MGPECLWKWWTALWGPIDSLTRLQLSPGALRRSNQTRAHTHTNNIHTKALWQLLEEVSSHWSWGVSSTFIHDRLDRNASISSITINMRLHCFWCYCMRRLNILFLGMTSSGGVDEVVWCICHLVKAPVGKLCGCQLGDYFILTNACVL